VVNIVVLMSNLHLQFIENSFVITTVSFLLKYKFFGLNFNLSKE